eukprot:gene12728-16178_t
MKNANTMKTVITLAAMAASLTAVAIPAMASAQTYTRTTVVMDRGDDRFDRRDDRGWDGGRWDNRSGGSVDRRIDMMQDRLEMGRRNGALSRREAWRIDSNLRDIVSLKRDFERSGRGLDGREVNILNAKLDYLSDQMRFERRDGNR